MGKHKNKIILGCLLIAVVVFAGCEGTDALIVKSQKAVKGVFPGVKEKPTGIQDFKLAKSLLVSKPVDVSLKDDPFRPLAGKISFSQGMHITEDANFVLTGVFISDEEHVALINSSDQVFVVKKNDKILSFRVKSVEENKVVLEKDGKFITLKLKSGEAE